LNTSAKTVLYVIAAAAFVVATYFLLPPIYTLLQEVHAPINYVSPETARPDTLDEAPIQDASNVTALGAGALLVMAYLTWALPRRFAVCPLLVMTCLMPLGQELILFGLHFPFFRLLLLVGALRVVVNGEAAGLKWTRLDSLFVAWMLVSLVFGTMTELTPARFQNRLGTTYNAAFCYFFVRCVILDFEDIVTAVRTLAWMSLPVAALMLLEKTTAHNLLSVFGGLPEMTQVREGQLRCQGAFAHPILAGTFGATQIPLFAALWHYRPKYRPLAAAATVSAIFISIAASSSGAFLTTFVAIGGLTLWKARTYLGAIRWGAVVVIIGMALAMNAPVWHVMADLGSVLGGTGSHRAWVIDQAIWHLNEWWLFGTTYTAHWGPQGQVLDANPNMMDITNQYVAEGVDGGLLKLGFFIAIIISCFKGLGQVLRDIPPISPAGFFVWAVGVSLFTHCFSFLSITYFDQSIVVWYWLMAVIACLGTLQGVSWVSLPVCQPTEFESGAVHS
jgi:hypothetical protein